MTRLIRPIQAFLHKLGIRFNIFIDDGRICAKSNDECFYKAQTVLLMFQLAGWNIQWLKTSQEPSQGLKYQGFITDTVQMKYWLDDKKLTEILKVLDSLLTANSKLIVSLDLAAALGKIAAICRSHGHIVNIMTCSSQHQLGKAVGLNSDWDSYMSLNEHSIDELSYLRKNLASFNGRFIPVHCSADEVFDVTENRKTIELIHETDLPFENLFVSNASDTNTFVYHQSSVTIIQDFEFSESERSMSLGQRELRAVLLTLTNNKAKLKNPNFKTIYWLMDSKNCYTFLRRGSKLRHIQNDVRQIKTLETKLGIRVDPSNTSANRFSRPGIKICVKHQ